jgi:hypothetical protein
MLKKIEYDALAADLSTVESMLASRDEQADPIGYFQYTCRKAELEEKLSQLGDLASPYAEMGVFFGGGPVQGSRGINADFAGKALDGLQSLITKRFSETAVGGLKQRGRLPAVDRSKMLVTTILRGSVGFVLEESGSNVEILNTPLRAIVDEVSDILSRVGADDDAIFDEVALTLDPRFLGSLKQFFVHLDEQEATLRVVNGGRDFLLDRKAVALARKRVQEIQIEERGDEFAGTIFLLPESRRFEFKTSLDGTLVTLVGSVLPRAAEQIAGGGDSGEAPIDARQISLRPWRVEILTREIRERNRSPRMVYSLLRLIGPVDQDEGNVDQLVEPQDGNRSIKQ